MKTLLKALLILLLMGGLVAGGVYGYTRYTQSQPVKVQPVSNWLMDYAPNQTYLGGSVISGESLLLTGNRDRTPLDIYVSEGQSVRTGDPLLRYDITKDTLELDEKLLERQKLYDTLEGLYKEYKRYAFEDYERTIPTATPTFTPTPRTEGEAPRDGSSLGIVRLSARMQQSMARRGGDGSEGDPYEFEVDMDSGLSDPIPESLLLQLQAQVATTHQPVHAWFTVRDTQGDSRPLGYLFLRFLPLENGVDRLNINLTAMTETKEPVAVMDADTMTPTGGHGYLKDPYIFSYREGYEVPGAFFSRYCRQANARGSYLYAELRGRRLTVAVDFTSMGTCILRLKPTPQVTPSPSPTVTPTPTPTPTPTVLPTATPEGWEDTPPTPYKPHRNGMSKAERQAYVEQLTQQLRDSELQYRQLCHDIERLLTETSQNGTVYSTFDGVVTTLNRDARSGEPLLEVRGGTGKSVIRCLLGETELDKYPLGSELTGFSYDIGENVTAVVTFIGNMPVTENYSNGGNPNSSGYVMLLEVQGDVELPLYSYVEFTSYEPLSKTGAIYLYEAFVREIDGQDCIFIVRDGFLKKVQVHTGRRTMEYIELVGSELTRDDLIAFPYGKNIRDGAPVEVTDGAW
jgi:hypothetical protein